MVHELRPLSWLAGESLYDVRKAGNLKKLDKGVRPIKKEGSIV